MSQDSRDDETTQPTNPLPIVKTEGSQGTTDVRRDNGKPPKRSRCRPTTWNVVFNGIVAVTTAILALIAYWQLESTHLDQRAWVGIKSSKMVDFVVGKPVRTELYLTNSGKTPARDVYVTVTIRSDAGPLDLKQFRQEIELAKGTPSHFVMFPDSEFTAPAHHANALTEQRWLLVKQGVLTIYVFGDITYFDVFGIRRLTEFCNIYHPGTNDFAFCPEGNKAY